MIIKDKKQLEKIMNDICEKVIDNVSDKVYVCLQNHIDKDVYGDLPNKQYEDGTGQPTFQFKDSFIFENTKKFSNEVTKLLWHDWRSMDAPSSAHPTRHGNYGGEGDIRFFLAEALNKYDYFGHKERNHFWDNFIAEIDEKIRGWFITEFAKYGVKYKF